MSLILERIGRWLGVALLVAVAVLWWSNDHLRKRIDKLEVQTTGLKAETSAAVTHDRGTVVVTQQKEKAHEATRKALGANSTYADEPVPDDIARLLRSPVGSPRSVPKGLQHHVLDRSKASHE